MQTFISTNTKTRLGLLLASLVLALGVTLTACGDDKKGDNAANNAANAPIGQGMGAANTEQVLELPHGDIRYSCQSVASAAEPSDPMSWTEDCVEVVSMAYRACGKSLGDPMVQCVNNARDGDQLSICLDACE